jgi:hypothetical protein
MNDLVILGIVLGGISVLGAAIAIWTELRLTRKSTDWHADLRALQLESARLTLQGRRDMADLKAYLKSVGIRLEQVFERVDDR